MSWKNELDRVVADVLARTASDASPDWSRATTLVNDLLGAAPSRPESQWHAGWLEETRARHAAREASRRAPAPATPADAESAPAPAPDAPPADAGPALAPASGGDAALWRFLGRLDAASRSDDDDRIRSLCADPLADEAASRAREGRILLRAAARALVDVGEDRRAFDLTVRHLATDADEAARKEADGLLAEAIHHADDVLADGDEPGAMAALDRARDFATAAGLDGRAHAKVERKRGRSHQLAGRWAEAESCYRAALDRLDAEDRYRSVLHGDLALAALGVRGTLDLLPVEGRANAADAEKLLTQGGAGGEGESYNAIYTLGVLAYERGDFAAAAERFREADRLMRETRAKARIVHARARFFLGASLLRQGVTGDALEEAGSLVRDAAHAASLDAALKQPVLDLLATALPPVDRAARGDRSGPPARGDGPPRSRGERGAGAGRGERRERGPRREGPPPDAREGEERRPAREPRGPREGRPGPAERMSRYERGGARNAGGPGGGDGAPATAPGPIDASLHLAEARRVLDRDPHRALQHVDGAFKARPGFEDWFAAYRVRLDALVRLAETAEARRTYERFRAKLHERGSGAKLEEVLLDASGPMSKVLDPTSLLAEKADLYEVTPGREHEFLAASAALAERVAAAGTPEALRRAAAIWREAAARGGDVEATAFDAARARARAASAPLDAPSADDVRSRLGAKAPKVLLVTGDESRRAQAARIEEIGRKAGFEGAFVVAGARPPHRVLADVEAACRAGTTVILVHHTATPDLREGIRRLAADLSVAVREIPYSGSAGLEAEVLAAVGDAVA
jgi:hypothetical protein